MTPQPPELDQTGNAIVKISARSRTPPFLAMDVLAEAREMEAAGADLVHMEVGEPGFGAPAAAREALDRALRRGDPLGYTDGLGRPDLREAIAALYRRRHGIELDPGRVVVTAGSSAGFSLAFLTLFDPGARVAIGDPGYPCYRNILGALGLLPLRVETTLETRFQPTPAQLRATGRVEGLLVASPANPTGTMLDRPALEALAAHCEATGTALISDEIYHGLEYGARAVSALEVTDEVVVINSLSKFHGMTGWRIGWMVLPERFVRPVQTLAQNLFICAAHASQVAGLGALSEAGEAEAAGHLPVYAKNREMVLTALEDLGFEEIAPADGAFYAYAALGSLAADSRSFCAGLLRHEGVATTPGLDFDPVRGHRTVRFSFAQPPERIAEGLRRLRRYVEAGCPG